MNKLLYNINTKRLEKVDEKTLLQIKNYNGINGTFTYTIMSVIMIPVYKVTHELWHELWHELAFHTQTNFA